MALDLLGPPRNTSYAETGLTRKGSGYSDALPHQLVTRGSNNVNFNPAYSGAQRATENLAYCVYAFEAKDFDRDLSLRFTWQGPFPAGHAYAAVANFARGGWEWYALEGDFQALPDNPGYFAPDGRLLCCVLSTGTAQSTLKTLRLGSAPPVISFMPNSDFGAKPFLVKFDLSGCYDPDGELVSFELDWEGDGSYDLELSSKPQDVIEHTFTASGAVYPVLRITDDSGISVTREARVVVNQNTPPYPQLSYTLTPPGGDVPVQITLDASASTDDGNQLDFAFDFEGDGIFDQHGSNPVAVHTYVNGGTFKPKIALVDEWGNYTYATPTLILTDPANQPPTAALQMQLLDSSFPQRYLLDAAASTDADGDVVWFDWDFDGDGNWDDSGTAASVEHNFYTNGAFTPLVRVHDNDDALDTAAGSALNIGAGWQPVVIPGFQSGEQTSLALITPATGPQRVALAATALSSTPVQVTTTTVDVLSSWPPPSLAASQNCDGGLDLLDVEGVPALFFQRAGAAAGGLSYVQAIDSGGTSWQTPVEVTADGSAGAKLIAAGQVEGFPAAVFTSSFTLSVRYARAADSSGTAFGTPATALQAFGGMQVLGLGLGSIAGNPAVVGIESNFGGNLYLNRSDDSTGASWPASAGMLATAVYSDDLRYMSLVDLAGRPGVYYINTYNGIFVRRGTDATGSGFGPALQVTPGDFHGKAFLRGVVWDGLPALCYADTTLKDIFVVRATSPDGSAWSAPEPIATFGELGGGLDALVLADGKTLIVSCWDKTVNKLKVFWRMQP